MAANTAVRPLKLHSPAGIEPAVFTWLENEPQVEYGHRWISLLLSRI